MATLGATGTIPDAQIPATIARDSEIAAAITAHEALADPHAVYQKESEKGAVNGYASLDASGFIPVGQIPTSQLTEAEALALYIPLTQRGAANGVAPLDSASFIPIGHIPTSLLSEAEALALYVPLTQRGAANGVASLDSGGTVPDAQIPAGIARDSEVTAAIAAHAGAADPHPTYLTAAEANAAYEVAGAVAAHVALADPHAQYQKESEKGVANGYASLDVGGFVPDAQIPAAIARDAEVTAAIATHAGLADPHPGYLTPAEGNAAYEALGAVAAHAGAADPHPTYLTATEGNAAYIPQSWRGVAGGVASLDGNATVPNAQLPNPMRVGPSAAQAVGTTLSVVANGNGIEWGHGNDAGYRSHIGCNVNNGAPWVAFNAEAGAGLNDYRTRGIPGALLRSDLAGVSSSSMSRSLTLTIKSEL